MIFEPYKDELAIINQIHKYNDSEYVVIRLTKTMIDKNNIDANALFRDLLKNNGFVDYDFLERGGNNGKKFQTEFVFNDNFIEVTMNFYRVKNSRGDRRFSIFGIKKMFDNNLIDEGDLLYISFNKRKSIPVITIVNVTNNLPSTRVLLKLFGEDRVNESLSRLIPMVRKIAKKGYHINSKGVGKIFPKDAGDTLESLLGIRTNNSQEADFEGIIELKSKTSKTMDTLFTLRPQFDNTPVADFEPNDRSRVSAFARLYGYYSEKHIGFKSLYITIGSESAPQNSFGFFLFVNEEERKIELRKLIDDGNDILTAYWTFGDLEEELHKKHPATLWVKAETRMNDRGIGEFKYIQAELSRSPQFATFLTLVKTGGITYDWRGYTTPEGAYSGKNHGNAWRIKNKQRSLLFGSMETINLQ